MNRFFSAGGSDFGERALITNEPRSATVMTITPTDLLVVDRIVFNRYERTILVLIPLLFFVIIERSKRPMKKNYKRKQNSSIDVLYFHPGQHD